MLEPEASHQREFQSRLREAWPELREEQVERVSQFYSLVLAENEKQNLTRLTSPRDFLEGHVLDVRELVNSGLVSFPAMDLGSGCGVPGLLSAAICEDSWVLVESEGHKAAFLKSAVEALFLKNVQVFSGRGEDYLKKKEVSSVVARAVGPASRIYSWIRSCSTWNNLVLLKGPGWDAEWEEFQGTKLKKELEVGVERRYSVGEPPKNLRIVRLQRVPRGTKG